jgi:signal transduction histidine kinase
VVVVGIVLFVVAFAQTRVVERHLVDAAEASAEHRAVDLAERVRDGDRPDALVVGDDDEAFAQVVDADGRSVVASDNVETGRAVVGLRPELDDDDGDDEGDGPEYETESGSYSDLPIDDGGRWRVVAVAVAATDGRRTVIAGQSLEEVESTVATIRRSWMVGIPILLVIVGFVTLGVVRRALRPVDRMRTDLDDITARHLDRRVTEPVTDDEIARLAGALNELLDRFEASVARERRFIGDASHELRSPLSALHAQLDVALAHPDGVDWPGTVRGALRDTERIEALAADLLVLARLDSDASGPPRESVDLAEVVAEVVGEPRPPGTVRVHARLEPDVVVRGRHGQLARVVRNLVDNAVRYAETSVEVRVGRDGSDAVVVVVDDGPGIPAAERTRVFERFTRLDDSRTRSEGGAGLGLAIAQEIVVGHGGTITIGEAGQGGPGATVTVRLPSA